jgi:hypothetical protein
MKRKSLYLAAPVLVASFIVVSCGLVAQDPPITHLSGLINDYTPSSVSANPWTMHGEWTLDLHRYSGAADFSMDMTMSNLGTTTLPGPPPVTVPDPTKPGNTPHTHHVRLRNARVMTDSASLSSCPTMGDSPLDVPRFMISGTVSLITGNGLDAPFEQTKPPTYPSPAPKSTLTVCITGGNVSVDPEHAIPYSNITLQFGAPASGHFGPQAIHGVVRSFSDDWGERD